MTHLNQVNLKIDDETLHIIQRHRLWGNVDNIFMDAVKEYVGTSKQQELTQM